MFFIEQPVNMVGGCRNDWAATNHLNNLAKLFPFRIWPQVLDNDVFKCLLSNA